MFKYGIAARIWLALFTVTLITAIGVAFATYWSFQKGLQGYLTESEVDRMNGYARTLGAGYEVRGSWDFLHENSCSVLRPIDGAGIEQPADTSGGLPRGLALYDVQGQHIAGSKDIRTDALRLAIHADGKAVGVLVAEPRRRLSSEVFRRFQQHQFQSIWFIAAAALALISVLNFLLTRGLLSPIQHLTKGSMQIAEGDYTLRVPENRNDEIGLLARNFNSMAAALETHEALRRQLMADVAHELRTPLAVLSAEIENMEDGIHAFSLEGLQSLKEEVNTLTRRVDDIRQISHAEAGILQYNWRPLDLAAWLEEERNRWQSRLAENGIAWEIQSDSGLLVRGDRERLHQFLQNLIENVRTHADGATLLRTRLYRESDCAVIECHDNGQGVFEDSLPKLFERFWREDRSRSRNKGGSGLGLAICRSIVEAHGGRIGAEHSSLGGLCVRACFPLIEVNT
jgi:two-component system sensor histidine kinase BaeS